MGMTQDKTASCWANTASMQLQDAKQHMGDQVPFQSCGMLVMCRPGRRYPMCRQIECLESHHVQRCILQVDDLRQQQLMAVRTGIDSQFGHCEVQKAADNAGRVSKALIEHQERSSMPQCKTVVWPCLLIDDSCHPPLQGSSPLRVSCCARA